MPCYFFHLHNDVDVTDEQGAELPGVDAALAYAHVNIREVACESLAEGRLDLDHFILVTDAGGDAVLHVSFGDAITVSGRS